MNIIHDTTEHWFEAADVNDVAARAGVDNRLGRRVRALNIQRVVTETKQQIQIQNAGVSNSARTHRQAVQRHRG